MKSKTTRKRIRTYISNESQVKNIRLLLPIVQRIVRAHLARQYHYSANDSIVHLNSPIKLYDTQYIKTKLHIIYTYNGSKYLRSLVVKRDESLYKYLTRGVI